jgi:hypothetical protein
MSLVIHILPVCTRIVAPILENTKKDGALSPPSSRSCSYFLGVFDENIPNACRVDAVESEKFLGCFTLVFCVNVCVKDAPEPSLSTIIALL